MLPLKRELCHTAGRIIKFLYHNPIDTIMKKIVLISCVKKKLDHKAKAKDMYISTLFRYNLEYAYSLHADKIFILSAKYGLLELDKEIEPYEKTLNNMSSAEIKNWASSVSNQLNTVANLKEDKFIFLAGEKYRKYLLPYLMHYEIPMIGLPIGKQLNFLKKHVKSK